MGTFTMTIDTGNDAFTGDPTAEIGRLMRETTRRVVNGHKAGFLLDINGNRVGTYELVD